MFIEVPEKVAKKIVVKRDGKKVEFDGAKIAIAIQKGFGDIIGSEETKTAKYNETDVNKVYSKVLSRIEELEGEKIKIEEIQDLIEEQLKVCGYQDVYEAFASYREKRAQSRQLFFDERKQHKFLKALENLGLKAQNVDENRKEVGSSKETSIGNMFQYGSTISRQFAITYIMKKRFSEAHENGDIYIHNMNFIPMGTTNCFNIDIEKLYKDGFCAGHSFIREPQGITSYTALATIAIQSNQNDQYGEQCIPSFDYYMAPGILKTFKKQFKQLIFDFLELTDFDKFIAINGIEREIEKINTIEFDPAIFDKYCRESEELKRMFKITYKKAVEKTNNITYQAMESFIHSLNIICSKEGNLLTPSSIGFGTDTSPEGRMVTTNFLKAIQSGLGDYETPKFPIPIFKLKDGVNLNKKDKNYDLFEMTCDICSKIALPNYAFLDAKFNKEYYKEDDYNTQVAYMGENIRILENYVDENKSIVAGRGNLSITSINLPRIGIKYGLKSNTKANMSKFYEELEEKLDLVKEQLIERFEFQCKKKKDNFPFLLGQELWLDSEKIKDTDNLRKVLKQGTLSIGFIGLAECLKALIGENHAESKQAQKLGLEIVEFMRKKCDEYTKKYNLNFNLIATTSNNSLNKFIKLDQAIYGKLKGITDKESYTQAFEIPNNSKVDPEEKIKLEAPYHILTNGGHITHIKLDKENMQNAKYIMDVVKKMKEEQIGYAKITYNSQPRY